MNKLLIPFLLITTLLAYIGGEANVRRANQSDGGEWVPQTVDIPESRDRAAAPVDYNEREVHQASVNEAESAVHIDNLASDCEFFIGSDIELLAKIVYLEAGNQSEEGMLAVANVVLNRVKSDKFPDTVYDVIFQPRQFQPAKDMDYIDELPIECIRAALMAQGGKNNIGQALYFLNPVFSTVENIDWFESLEFVETIGDHDFYK
jgi:spore germination cell wall hydrolase CwlJ-like protein